MLIVCVGGTRHAFNIWNTFNIWNKHLVQHWWGQYEIVLDFLLRNMAVVREKPLLSIFLIFEKKDNHQLTQLNQQQFLNTLSPLPIDGKSLKTVSYCNDEKKKNCKNAKFADFQPYGVKKKPTVLFSVLSLRAQLAAAAKCAQVTSRSLVYRITTEFRFASWGALCCSQTSLFFSLVL